MFLHEFNWTLRTSCLLLLQKTHSSAPFGTVYHKMFCNFCALKFEFNAYCRKWSIVQQTLECLKIKTICLSVGYWFFSTAPFYRSNISFCPFVEKFEKCWAASKTTWCRINKNSYNNTETNNFWKTKQKNVVSTAQLKISGARQHRFEIVFLSVFGTKGNKCSQKVNCSLAQKFQLIWELSGDTNKFKNLLS